MSSSTITLGRRALTLLLLASCAGILVAKAFLIPRININWDEFYFLSHIHQGARGELTLFLQGVYTHAFRWLVPLGNDEIDQILIGRGVMWLLLVVTSVLIWNLASIWVHDRLALLAPLCYLSMSPVINHGASFRSDSLLAPLTVLTLILLARQALTPKSAIPAGICIGVGMAINIKMSLMLPLFILFIGTNRDAAGHWTLRKSIADLLMVGTTALLTAAALLVAHKASLAPADINAAQYTKAALSKVLLDVPLLPRKEQYETIRDMNKVAWLLIFSGGLFGLVRREFRAATIGILALAPILIYRNAWPYYYIVMLAPACVLAPIAVRSIAELLTRMKRFDAPSLVASVFCLLLIQNGLQHLLNLPADGQRAQRAVVAAVHRIFIKPVPYIDHSGMIASFPKVNLFMSTWGLENYRAAGESFMEISLEHRAPLLLVNRPVLNPDKVSFSRLLQRDQELIRKYYVSYWGPIKIAGASTAVATSAAATVDLPFPGKYRLRSNVQLLLNGRPAHDGDVIDFKETRVSIRAVTQPPSQGGHATLLWAEAQDPPAQEPPSEPLYVPL